MAFISSLFDNIKHGNIAMSKYGPADVVRVKQNDADQRLVKLEHFAVVRIVSSLSNEFHCERIALSIQINDGI